MSKKELPLRYGQNQGHGHVWERPDKMTASCGGPGMCQQCSTDFAECNYSPAPSAGLSEETGFFCEDYKLVEHRNKHPDCLYCRGMDLEVSVKWLKEENARLLSSKPDPEREMIEKYKPTEPDDLLAALDVMDERWGGYQNCKTIIRDHVTRMRAALDRVRDRESR